MKIAGFFFCVGLMAAGWLGLLWIVLPRRIENEVVPQSRIMTGDPDHGLFVQAGEKMLAASCCEQCRHVQRFWITCEE